MKEIKNAVIGVIVLAITSAGGVLINKYLGEEEETIKETSTPTVVVNIPEQKVKKDTIVKKVYIKPVVKKTETEKRKEELDW